MEKKMKILGVNKSEFVSEYAIKKEKGVLENIKLFLEKIGYDKNNYDDFYYLFYDEESSISNVTKLKDIRFNVKNKESEVDIFIGNKKVLLVIRTKKDMQQKISKELLKIGVFKK